jgi:hypothetical protein
MDEGENGSGLGAPAQRELSRPPPIADADASSVKQAVIVARPSIETGVAYKSVSKAYSDAVHSVLMGEQSAPEAAAKLEKQLMAITGFRPGPPREAGQ